jgi:hypothetical protein
MDLYTGTSSVSCSNGQKTWTISGTINLDGVFPGHKVWVGSRNTSTPAEPLRMFRIATIDRTAKTFTTHDNADQTYTDAPFFIDFDGTDTVGFATFLFTTVLNQLSTMFGVGSTQFAGGGSQFMLPRDVGASAVAELAFALRSGATHTRSFFWRQRQVSGSEVLELIATPDGTTEIIVLSVNRATGALTIGADQTPVVTLRGDANYTITSADRDIIINAAFTAGRTFTLPANSDRALNGRVRVIDGIDAISPGTPLTFARAGSDTINGGTTFVVTRPRAVIDIIKTGTGQWTIDPDLAGDAATRGLNAILATASDVVDVMVYDTRLDSDGGTWRNKCAHTSWYNEAASATRGSRKEFPLVAGIVARQTSVTIYDLTDFDGSGVPRLWKQFATGGTIESNNHNKIATDADVVGGIFAVNGHLFVAFATATNISFTEIDFIADRATSHRGSELRRYRGGLGSSEGLGSTVVGSQTILAGNANHVHARVYPGAPLDGAGLPIPTVAVATASGVSVIHPWGAVYDITRALGFDHIALGETGLWASSAGNVQFGPLPYADIADTSWRGGYYVGDGSALKGISLVTNTQAILFERAIGQVSGLNLLAVERGSPTLGMVSYAAINFATGWQVGDIRLAALCDTTTGNVTGTAELITNGDFATDLTGWTAGTGWAHSSGTATKTAGTAANLSQVVTTVAGQTYLLSADATRSAGTLTVEAVGATVQTLTATGRVMAQFTATGTSTTISFNGDASFAGTVDNVSVKLAVPDRSYKGRGLQVVGTLARAVVNTGNDLAAFSGFSGSNYLRQPFNPDMAFGTGDFYAGIWAKRSTIASFQTVLSRAPASAWQSGGWGIGFMSTGVPATRVFGISSVSGFDPGINVWTKLEFVRRSGVLEFYQNGVLQGTESFTADTSLSAAELFVGCTEGPGESFTGSLALLRISATAPSKTQIARMYADEAPLFNAGAKACLGGTSNAVADLAYDESRNVTLVATADGVSEFSGLNRTAYLDTANTALTNDAMTAVASAAGYRLMAGGAQAIAFRETANLLDVIERYPPRQREVFKAFGRTTDATPTNLAPHIYVGERETVSFIAEILARQVGATATEYARYLVNVSAKRDAGGNVTVTAVTTTTQEVTAGMDATAVAVTASQTIALQVTGKAATTLVWSAEIRSIVRVSEELSYAA